MKSDAEETKNRKRKEEKRKVELPPVRFASPQPRTAPRTQTPITQEPCVKKKELLLLLLLLLCGFLSDGDNAAEIERTLVIFHVGHGVLADAKHGCFLRPLMFCFLSMMSVYWASGTRRRTPHHTRSRCSETINSTDPTLKDFRLAERNEDGICSATLIYMPPKTGLLFLPPLSLSRCSTTPRAPPSQSRRLPNNIGSKGG